MGDIRTKGLHSSLAKRRRMARLFAVQALYCLEIRAGESPDISELVLDVLAANNYIPGSEDIKEHVDTEHLLQITKGFVARREEIHALVGQHLAEGWRLTRLPTVTRHILCVACLELIEKTVEKAVTINEYLEIAKILNHAGEAGFINGVLDRIAADQAISEPTF